MMFITKQILKATKRENRYGLDDEEGGVVPKSSNNMGPCMQLSAFLNSIFGIVLLIIVICSDEWEGRESDMLTIYKSLWVKCTDHHHEHGCPKFCLPLEGAFGYEEYQFTEVLVFLFSACVLYFIGFIMSIILMCQRENRKLQIGVAIVHFIVFILTLIGLAIYDTTFHDNYYGLKWSSALGWGSTLCFLAALIFTLIDLDRKKPSQ